MLTCIMVQNMNKEDFSIILAYKYFYPSSGGIESLMYLIAKGLSEYNIHVKVLTLNAVNGIKTNKKLPTRLFNDVQIIRVEPIFIINKHYDFTFPTRSISKIIEESDIVHIFSSMPSAFILNISMLSSMKRKNIVWQPIFSAMRLKLFEKTPLYPFLYINDKVIPRIIAKKSKAIIALSKNEGRIFRRYGAKNIYVLGECVEEIKPSRDFVNRVLKRYNLEEEEYVLSVGRLVWYKGHDLLVRSWLIVEKFLPHFKLVIVGKDWGIKKTLTNIIKKYNLKNVIIIDGVSDQELHALYEGCLLVASLSRFETFHRIALEAWSHKKPILALDLGEATAHIINERNGVLFNSENPLCIARKIIEMYYNKKKIKYMGMSGYNLFKKNYDYKAYVQKLVAIYREV